MLEMIPCFLNQLLTNCSGLLREISLPQSSMIGKTQMDVKHLNHDN